MGTARGSSPHRSVSPNRASESQTCGSIEAGMPNRRHSSPSHCCVWMLKSWVRLALEASVLWTRPPVICHIVQVSIVPSRSSPRFARSSAPGTCFSIQLTFGAEKKGENCSPVFSCTACRTAGLSNRSQSSAARLHCHTTDSHTGSPVCASHTQTLSRWLVTATPTMSPADMPAS